MAPDFGPYDASIQESKETLLKFFATKASNLRSENSCTPVSSKIEWLQKSVAYYQVVLLGTEGGILS